MIAYIHAAWDDSPDTKIYIEAVHRLNELGAVVTHRSHGTSQEGFDAEWRESTFLTVDGDHGQPLRVIRRGRPRLRDREVRQSAGRRRGWKTRPAK